MDLNIPITAADLGFNFAALLSTQFWMALAAILWVDLLLSGDNALVIAMATRNLEPRYQTIARWGGTAVAVILRLVMAGFAGYLMGVPFLSAFGGILLVWIAYKLVASGEEDHSVVAKASLAGAVWTISVADASMSLDNVIAVAGLAHGDNLLMALGILLSIPMVVAGSILISWLLQRFPLLVWAGAGLLAYVAGTIFLHDKFVSTYLADLPVVTAITPYAVAVLVLATAYFVKLGEEADAVAA